MNIIVLLFLALIIGASLVGGMYLSVYLIDQNKNWWKKNWWRMRLTVLSMRYLVPWWKPLRAWKMTGCNEWLEYYKDGYSPKEVISKELSWSV